MSRKGRAETPRRHHTTTGDSLARRHRSGHAPLGGFMMTRATVIFVERRASQLASGNMWSIVAPREDLVQPH